MKFTSTRRPDLIQVQPRVFEDEKEFLFLICREDRYSRSGIDVNFARNNHYVSQKGVLRRLCYQICRAQGKLVRAVSREMFDAAGDIRRSLSTFEQRLGVNLYSEDRHQWNGSERK